MNLAPIDMIIVGAVFVLIVGVSLYAQRLNKSVADFLSANRCAGRYLLTLAMGVANFGAITIVANFEKYYQAGFGALWWIQMIIPLQLVLALSGWVIYRFRATRALTIAQFYEMRYSRRFRIFAGSLAFFAGLLNYGIFPVVTSRFIVYFFGFPPDLLLLGFEVPTVAVVMAFMLSLAVFITLTGGQITVMISDFLQSQLLLVSFLIITILLIFQIGWSDMMQSLVAAAPEGKSMVNPFDQEEIPDFNIWFFLILAFNIVYGYMAWQGSQGYNSSARSPHEAKMARVLAEWRANIQILMMAIVPVAAFVFINATGDPATVGEINQTLGQLGDEQLRKQMQVPVTLAELIPPGLLGLFCAAIVAAAVSTDDTYLHSWGSIFIQDVVMPIRRKHLSPRAHIWMLRGSVFGVAVFVYVFGLLFPLKEYIFMYWQLTGAIYIGGAGSVIIGGLYTRWGTTAGAWGAMITGSAAAFTGLVLRQAWESVPFLAGLAPEFPLNGIQVSFVSGLSAITVYVTVSLLTRKESFDLDAMLHRDPETGAPTEEGGAAPHKKKSLNRFQRIIGINDQFTFGDRLIYYLKIAWVGFFFSVFLIGTSANLLFSGISDEAWVRWWTIQIFIMIAAGIATVIWFGIGGAIDLRKMFKQLRSIKRDEYDDGSV